MDTREMMARVVAGALKVTDPVLKSLSLWYDFYPMEDEYGKGYRGRPTKKAIAGTMPLEKMLTILDRSASIKKRFEFSFRNNELKAIGATKENSYIVEVGMNYIHVFIAPNEETGF